MYRIVSLTSSWPAHYLHGADVHAVLNFVGDERVPKTVQFDVHDIGIFRRNLDSTKQMIVHPSVLVGKEQAFGQRKQFFQ